MVSQNFDGFSSSDGRHVETTGSALMSTLVFLGLNPREQETAYKEILEQVPLEGNMASVSMLVLVLPTEFWLKNLRDVTNLKYVLACMHEAHRLVRKDIPELLYFEDDSSYTSCNYKSPPRRPR
jgi:hypothetical protein